MSKLVFMERQICKRTEAFLLSYHKHYLSHLVPLMQYLLRFCTTQYLYSHGVPRLYSKSRCCGQKSNCESLTQERNDNFILCIYRL